MDNTTIINLEIHASNHGDLKYQGKLDEGWDEALKISPRDGDDSLQRRCIFFALTN